MPAIAATVLSAENGQANQCGTSWLNRCMSVADSMPGGYQSAPTAEDINPQNGSGGHGLSQVPRVTLVDNDDGRLEVVDTDRETVAILFQDAASTYGAAIDANDSDGALWYANHLRESLNTALNTDFSTSELAELLVATGGRELAGGTKAWSLYVADFFDELAG